MSMIRCADCSKLIDTDEDVESYIEKLDKWLCWVCREELSEEDLEEPIAECWSGCEDSNCPYIH